MPQQNVNEYKRRRQSYKSRGYNYYAVHKKFLRHYQNNFVGLKIENPVAFTGKENRMKSDERPIKPDNCNNNHQQYGQRNRGGCRPEISRVSLDF